VITKCDIPKKLNADAKKELTEYATHLEHLSADEQGSISGFFKKFLG
jgi:hypothetical protein